METDSRKKGITQGILALWRAWALSNGFIMVILLMSLYLPKAYVPLIVLVFLGVLHTMVRRNRAQHAPYCYRIPYTFAWILFWSALFIILNNVVVHGRYTMEWNGQPYNPDIPLLAILIIAPVGFFISTIALVRGTKSSFCVDCEIRNGMDEERGFMGKIFSQEAEYQTGWMVVQWGLLTIIEWVYYFMFYINININTPDRFFFVWLPVLVLSISIIYMGIRYSMLWSYYCNDLNMSRADIQGKSQLRFIVICDNKVWLHIPMPEELDADPTTVLRIDTPVKTVQRYQSNITTFEARDRFRVITGVKCPEIKKLFVNNDNRMISNISHFAVFFDSPEPLKNASVTGEWFTLGDIQAMHKAHLLAPLFESEMYRLHTVAMAWKTYTREGKRRYAVKYYRPTFRLSDIPNWNVDFSDPTWLFVARNNEDSHFFRLRKFWNKYITGIGI